MVMFEEILKSEDVKEWQKELMKYEFAVQEVSTKINILNTEFKNLHDYNPIEHVKTRIKKPKSIIQKLINKDIEPNAKNASIHLKDIAGIRIICSFDKDIYRVFELLTGQSDIKVLEVKDYIKAPKENGYRSLHAIISIPIFLSTGVEEVLVEIQIRTIAMDFWASLEHKIYYKYRNKTFLNISDELKECAEMIALLDKKMFDIKEEIEKIEK
ncbi:MAG: GTP pyrophosphokinase [Clostridium sp.]|uniref:GTP pyrophosphokinase n=1 Tax=Clostridium TaxID=1485 RepID=UPI002152E166|nr:GTP pyrophosphokinase family protein [Clostridium sp. LY3-2]MCR6513296.1 GTP pyrophosphokinase family protein [Clostridium sp. LY3-2]